jgi:hypothetical protein
VLNEQLDNSRVGGEHVDRPGFDLGQLSRMEILNRKRHEWMLAIMLTIVNAESRGPGVANVQAQRRETRFLAERTLLMRRVRLLQAETRQPEDI